MRVGRNETCPCGSGKKYKNCCEGNASRQSRGLTMMVAAIAVIAAVGLIASIRERKGSKRTTTAAPIAASRPAGTPGMPQPPGAVPPGKVWSVEHGHWHDEATGMAPQPAGNLTPSSDNSAIKIEPLAAGTPVPPTTAPITITPHNAPAPPGPAPEGKVWSPEHGHWHDLPKP